MTRKNTWGSVRKLPSGKWQARLRIDGMFRAAPTIFTTKREADTFLAATRADLERGTWQDPDAGKVIFRESAETSLSHKPELRPRTREGYEINLRLHILPVLGDAELGKINPTRVRAWHAGLVSAGNPGAPTIAKCYRLLHAIMATAVVDELIPKIPCVIKGASTEKAGERPVANVAQVAALADAIEPRLRVMVLLATYTTLRLGELKALRRDRVDLEHGTVDMVEQYQELKSGKLVLGPPKSDAGHRTVTIPAALLPEIEAHLAEHAAPGKEGLVFCGRDGYPLNSASFYKAWHRALDEVGMTDFHFHDLRHTGNTLAAATEASTKELMGRMGHSSPRAPLIYQHATQDRDAVIAAAPSIHPARGVGRG